MTITVPKPLAEEMYRRMQLIRRFEEWVVKLVESNEIAGVTHESVGQEAVAVGVCLALRDDDVITSTHRGHGHIIAKGGNVAHMLAELLGREGGYNKGRGGSMHIADMALGIFGANGIVTAGCPMACGTAYAFKRRGQDRVAASFFGDGGVNHGLFHEALNLAAIWALPVVFVCENNGYAITTPIASVTKVELYTRAAAYGMPGEAVDGMDVQAVYEATRRAVERARAGAGPSLIECRTYRFVGHYTAERFMKLDYRSDEEIVAWRKRDAIPAWSKRLGEAGLWRADDQRRCDAAVERELDQAVAIARQSPWPSADTALDHVYARTYPGLPAQGFE
ncbi:MAG: thiamine pyrophosphate-dependent dehydrogenase E1 component subunit alpha [Alphaproteobacteria bacterium]|nr:thiamine pyrophosphate-dependent dehydrogenase E1 component subunit alpha [Alphaproteobacteria bacterium]